MQVGNVTSSCWTRVANRPPFLSETLPVSQKISAAWHGVFQLQSHLLNIQLCSFSGIFSFRKTSLRFKKSVVVLQKGKVIMSVATSPL